MDATEDVKRVVREKYAALAREGNSGACCTPGGVTNIGEDYAAVEGYFGDADLGLGCGVPTEFARIVEGETVLDLGSGAGNDAFVARSHVGARGRVIGVDMTGAMVEKARANCRTLGFENVEFLLGEIEDLPLGPDTVDVVLSNCVLNLVPDKRRAFAEIFRVLRPGGRFSISDVVTTGVWPQELKSAAERYVGCVAGAADRDVYLKVVRGAGFSNVSVLKERRIEIPDEALSRAVKEHNAGAAVLSITLYGEKPRSN